MKALNLTAFATLSNTPFSKEVRGEVLVI